MVQEGYTLEGKPKIIRRMRFDEAKVVNISTDCKDLTYISLFLSAHTKHGAKITKWAYYDERLESILVQSIEDDITVNLLVHRLLYKYIKKGESKPKYDTHDFIANAELN